MKDDAITWGAERIAPKVPCDEWEFVQRIAETGKSGMVQITHNMDDYDILCTPERARALLAYRDSEAKRLSAADLDCLDLSAIVPWVDLTGDKRRSFLIDGHGKQTEWGATVAKRARELSSVKALASD